VYRCWKVDRVHCKMCQKNREVAILCEGDRTCAALVNDEIASGISKSNHFLPNKSAGEMSANYLQRRPPTTCHNCLF
jgi:hypothetical protein